jgi:2-amino-4-hydroxy-6-hydroxymethyldihydropteridine diphosphokinase
MRKPLMPTALAYLSLGSNLGHRRENLLCAAAELAKAGLEVVRSSSIYETEPQDFADQPAFLNCVLAVRSELSPFHLLRLTQGVETALGRVRPDIPKGPRLIDIDILLLGEFIVQDERLTIPHPRMLNRRFVLEPLLEIAPDLRCPGTGALVRDLLRNVSEQGIVAVCQWPGSISTVD